MATQDIFLRTVLTDKVVLKPWQLSSNSKEVIQFILKNKFEGKCSYHGYIKPGSIKVHNYSMGKVIDSSLNGDVEYFVQYNADICNPAIGSIIPAIVTNKNVFGILAEAFINIPDAKKNVSILEIIVVKTHHTEKKIDFDKVKESDLIDIEIMGKKFELNDKKISAWGKIVKSKKRTLGLDHVELVNDQNLYIETNEDDKDSDQMSDNMSDDEQDGLDADQKKDIFDVDNELVKTNKNSLLKKNKLKVKPLNNETPAEDEEGDDEEEDEEEDDDADADADADDLDDLDDNDVDDVEDDEER